MNGMTIFKIAWRNLWRQKRRTILTLISIAFGGFLAVLMTGTQDFTWVDFIDSSARLGSGHISIQHPEYLDRPTLSRTVTETDQKRAAVEGDEDVSIVVERTSGQAMLATAHDSFGAFFMAYDPTRENEYTQEWSKKACKLVDADSPLPEGQACYLQRSEEQCAEVQGCEWDYSRLVAGEFFEAADSRGIILGEVLAENLNAELGDKVVFTLTDKSGEIVTSMERLSGIITTGSAAADAGIALFAIDTVRGVVGYDPTESTQVAIFLNNGRRTLSVSERIDALVSDDAEVLTWDQMSPEIKTFIAMKKGGGAVMSIVIGILVAAGIFNTIFMSVMERVREFGVMMAIGYQPGQLFRLVMAESGILAILGLIACAIPTIPVYNKLVATGLDFTQVYMDMGILDKHGSMDVSGVGMDPVLPFGIFPESAAAIIIAILGATILAGVYPAWKAGRVDPIESINLV